MTRILYLASVDLPHRKARAIQVVNTAHALARAGARVTLVGGRRGSGGAAAVLRPFGLTPHPRLEIVRLSIVRPPQRFDRWFTRTWQASYLAGLAAMLPRFLAQRPNAIVVRDLRLASLLTGLGEHVQRRLVYEVHDLSSFEAEVRGDAAAAARLHHLEAGIFLKVGHVVCITSALRGLISERHERSVDSMTVIPDGTAAVTQPERTDAPRAGVYYVGQLYGWKGVDTLIQAAARFPDPGYVIVGGTEEPGTEDRDAARLAGLAASLHLEERVRFTGWVPYSRVQSMLRDAAVTIIPLPDTPFGRYFTSPLKLFDYMAAGVPIVASDLPSLRDVLEHERNALLVPADNPDALAQAIRRLYADSDLAQRLADEAQKDVAQYTWDARAARLLQVVSRHLPHH